MSSSELSAYLFIAYEKHKTYMYKHGHELPYDGWKKMHYRSRRIWKMYMNSIGE